MNTIVGNWKPIGVTKKGYLMMDTNNQELKDYIMLMLGAPVVEIELDDKQIDLAIEVTEKRLNEQIDWQEHKETYERLLRYGSLCQSKIILGRIRSKFVGLDSTPDDGRTLLREGHDHLGYWEDLINNIEQNLNA